MQDYVAIHVEDHHNEASCISACMIATIILASCHQLIAHEAQAASAPRQAARTHLKDTEWNMPPFVPLPCRLLPWSSALLRAPAELFSCLEASPPFEPVDPGDPRVSSAM